MAKTSILHIVLSTVSGGMENVIYNIASGYDAERFEMSVGCFDEIGHLSAKMEPFGVKSKMIPRMPSITSMVYPGPLIKFIKESGCDIVHTHSGCWFKVAVACAYISGIKLIYTDHGRFFPERKQRVFLDKLSIPFTHKIVAVGDTLKDYLINDVKFPARKTIRINNGIDTNRFKPAENRKEIRKGLGYNNDDIVIAMVARLDPIKNHRLLINTFRGISGKYPHAKLMIVGDGQLRSELKGLVSEYQLENRISLMGDQPDVPQLLQAADFATLSSVSEGISLTILEAMSTGLPVVATAVGGTPTIISDGENGYLVKSDDIESYSECLGKMLESSDDRAKMGQNAREHILANWSLSRMTKEYEELYSELTDNSK